MNSGLPSLKVFAFASPRVAAVVTLGLIIGALLVLSTTKFMYQGAAVSV